MKYVDRFGDGFETWARYDIPDEWIPIVDEALDRIFEIAPKTKIHQIKTKFGGLRLYLDPHADTQSVYDQVSDIVRQTEERCFVC